MKLFTKTLEIVTIIFLLLNSLIYIATVIELLEQWTGALSYFLWIIVAPVLSPAMLVLPWFDAWVNEENVNSAFLIIWIVFIICVVLRLITAKWESR